MASTSVSSLILFIAAIILAASVAGTMVTTVDDISNSIADNSEEAAQSIDTDVTIISDPDSGAIYNDSNDTVTVLVKNTGSRTLDASADELDVLLDGQYLAPENQSTTVVTAADWRVGNVLRLTFDASLDQGEHRVVVRVDGDETILRFYV